jgi:hypothetical protein
MLFRQHVHDVGIAVLRGIARGDLRFSKPVKRRNALVVRNRGFEEVDYFFVFGVLWAVAGRVEGREAGGVFAEFVAPETGVVLVLGDPVCVPGREGGG